jgi:hypothetical protein
VTSVPDEPGSWGDDTDAAQILLGLEAERIAQRREFEGLLSGGGEPDIIATRIFTS